MESFGEYKGLENDIIILDYKEMGERYELKYKASNNK